jgi:hypothetical protein
MGVKTTVFASKSERANFYKLCRVWGEKYRIHHNLPFLNVFNLDGLIDWTEPYQPVPLHIPDVDKNRLKKTSIDYTLCGNDDTPILCVEFDGMQQGFNVGAEYHPKNPILGRMDPWRQQITELKLKVGIGSFFPFFVVGSRQFEELTPETQLTIVDGIIGEVLSQKAATEVIDKGVNPEDLGLTDEEYASLSPPDIDELVQDWVIGVEVDAEMTHNPVSRLRIDMTATVPEVRSWRGELLQYPPLPENVSFSERVERIRRALLNGARVTLHTSDRGDVQAEAWMPNFQVPWFSGVSLLEDIAYILAMQKYVTQKGLSLASVSRRNRTHPDTHQP